jgi:hypothetical protein
LRNESPNGHHGEEDARSDGKQGTLEENSHNSMFIRESANPSTKSRFKEDLAITIER